MKKLILISLMIVFGCTLISSGYALAKKAPKAILIGMMFPSKSGLLFLLTYLLLKFKWRTVVQCRV